MPSQRLTVFAGPHDVLLTEDIEAPEFWNPSALRDLGSARLSLHGPVPLALLHQDGQAVAVYLGRSLIPEQSRRLGQVPAGLRWLTGQLPLPFHGVPLRAWIGPDLFFFQHRLDPPRAWLLPYLLALPDTPVEPVQADDGETWRFRVGPSLYCYDGHDKRGERLFGAGATSAPRAEHASLDETDRIGHILGLGAIRL